MLREGALPRLALAAAIAVTVAAFVLSLLPHVPMPDMRLGDKLVHSSAYGALALLWRLALNLRSRWVLAGVFGIGALIEGLQGFTPWRQFEWADMLANGSGAAAGLAVWWLVRRWAQKPRP
jgi:VanZ family protein